MRSINLPLLSHANGACCRLSPVTQVGTVVIPGQEPSVKLLLIACPTTAENVCAIHLRE